MKYWMQTYRRGQHTTWGTESRHDDLAAAISAADHMVTKWSRIVRVIDGGSGKVMYRAGAKLSNASRARNP